MRGVLRKKIDRLLNIGEVILHRHVQFQKQLFSVFDRQTLVGEEVDEVALEPAVDLGHEGFAQGRLKGVDVGLVDGLLAYCLLNYGKGVVGIFYIFYCLSHRGDQLVLPRKHTLHANDVWELPFNAENLNLLVEGHCVNPWDAYALLVVKLIFEVLDVEVLQLSWHGLNLLKKVIIIVIHDDFAVLHHVMQVEFVNFLQSKWLDTDEVAVLAVAECELLFIGPCLLDEVDVLVEAFSELILYCELILVGD